MRKNLLVLFVLMSSFVVSYGQSVKLIEGFDGTATDTTYQANIEGTLSYMQLSQSSDKTEGTSSLQINTRIGAYHPWGSYAQLIKRVPDGQPFLDWSSSDSLSLWVKVLTPPVNTGYLYFRIHIADRPTPTDPIEEYIFEDSTLVDQARGWINLRVALKERYQENGGATVPNDSGFIVAPSSWGGFTYNNRKLDFDKIIGYNIAVVTSGYVAPDNIPADSMIFLVDQFERFGNKSVPVVIFNGISLPNTWNSWTWGNSTLETVVGAGISSNTNALKWTLGDGWTGSGFDVIPSLNLGGSWQQDSLHFKLKCPVGTGDLRMQFESAAGKDGKIFTPIEDNTWHAYSIALRDMTFHDGTTDIDSTNVTKFGFMSDGHAVAGTVVYLTDMWTGNPVFDVIPPVAVANIGVTPGSFNNLVTWNDVPGESNETYSIYYSKNPITDVSAPGVEIISTSTLKVLEGIQVVEHLLRAPATDQSVSYYYAVLCTDAAGNIGPIAQFGPVSNVAKGITTLSLTAPSNFAADGNLQEWAGIPSQNLALSDGSGFKVVNTLIDNDADCSGKVYLAVDNDNLYVAFDMEDDIISFNSTLSTYLNDSPDMFIGLYNGHGLPHAGYKRGGEPDYHFRFAKDRLLLDGGVDSILVPGANYYWGEKFPTGYVVEAKIPFSTLAQRMNDSLFVPKDGMRIPLDYAINDADATGQREGILTYSPYNEDKSWSTPIRWLNTWVGTKWDPTGVKNNQTVVNSYSLSQNYPNPFNPTTKIQYSLEKGGMVSLKVFDVLGRLVKTLVNNYQGVGKYSINFNASHLSSGIYFYQLESGSFNSIKKMILVK